jgi:hypothetical protein
MLVTNVSLRPPRTGIAADIAELAEAVDASATGQVVFATLVDDPASVREFVDAYLGEIMLEAASAAASADAGLAYAAAIDEAVTAADTQDATAGIALVARSAMLPGVFVNSDGTSREANVNSVMVNL